MLRTAAGIENANSPRRRSSALGGVGAHERPSQDTGYLSTTRPRRAVSWIFDLHLSRQRRYVIRRLEVSAVHHRLVPDRSCPNHGAILLHRQFPRLDRRSNRPGVAAFMACTHATRHTPTGRRRTDQPFRDSGIRHPKLYLLECRLVRREKTAFQSKAVTGISSSVFMADGV